MWAQLERLEVAALQVLAVAVPCRKSISYGRAAWDALASPLLGMPAVVNPSTERGCLTTESLAQSLGGQCGRNLQLGGRRGMAFALGL